MIRLHTLGALELRGSDGREVRAVLAQPKRVALLVYLVVAWPRGFRRRDTLLELFWPERDEERARAALNQAVYHVRRSLGSDAVVSRGNEELGMNPERLWCDAVAFDEALDREALQDALGLYRGDLLPGFFLSDALQWERWLEEERARLRARAAAAAWKLTERAAARKDSVLAARWGRRAMALAPTDEARLRQLIASLDRVGDRAGALGVYEESLERLARDFEIEPSSETRALIESIRSREEPLTHASPSAVENNLPSSESRGPDGAPGSEIDRQQLEATNVKAHGVSPRGVREGWRVPLLSLAALLAAGLVASSLMWPRVRAEEGSPEPTGAAAAHARNNLAVLPLTDESPNAEDGYFADGLTEELISRLSGLRDLRVIGRTSVMPYRDSEMSLAGIGRELGVGALLTGSVRRAGERVSISMKLVDAHSQELLWSNDYDAKLVEIAAVQRDIYERVVRALGLPEPSREGRALAPQVVESPEAITEYLKGRYFLGRLDAGAFGEARDHFQRSLDLDPTFARAWSGLSEAYSYLASLAVLPASEAYPRARAAAERALELDPDLGEAHAALSAALTWYYWDTEEAERHFRRAIELEPGSARSHRLYAVHLRNLGRFDEALGEVRVAKELDPLFAFSHVEEGIILYMARRYDEAIAELQQLLSVAPGHAYASIFIAMARAEKEEFDGALAALRDVDPQIRNTDVQAVRGYVYARMGREEDAREVLAMLEDAAKLQPVSDFQKAAIHVGLGEQDRALALLERAVEEPTWHVRLLKVTPIFDPLRSEPRFHALLESVRLAE